MTGRVSFSALRIKDDCFIVFQPPNFDLLSKSIIPQFSKRKKKLTFHKPFWSDYESFFDCHYIKLVTKISIPMKIRIAPPKIPAFPASFVPAFLPMAIPPKQMKNVTTAMIRAAKTASSRT